MHLIIVTVVEEITTGEGRISCYLESGFGRLRESKVRVLALVSLHIPNPTDR